MKKVKMILAVAVVATVGLMAFSPVSVNSTPMAQKVADGEEELDLYSFIYNRIISKIEAKNVRTISKNTFSRCPSGYEFEVNEGYDWEGKVAEGKIVLYNGCNPTDVCKFKADIEKGIALVSPLDTDEYVAVDTWLEGQKPAPDLTKK